MESAKRAEKNVKSLGNPVKNGKNAPIGSPDRERKSVMSMKKSRVETEQEQVQEEVRNDQVLPVEESKTKRKRNKKVVSVKAVSDGQEGSVAVKKSKKKKVCMVLAIILAICLGVVAYFLIAGAKFNRAILSADELEGLASTSRPVPTDGTTPADHQDDPNANAYYAFSAMQNESYIAYSTGVSATVVDQQVKAVRVVNDTEVYKESISYSSMKGVGVRTYVSGNNYIRWEASKVNSVNSVSWKSSASKISKEKYIELYGGVPRAYTPYIMTDETILSSQYLGEEDGVYSFQYTLDNEKATEKISMEMRTMAGTKELPLFERVSLIIRLDENWRVLEVVTDCKYQVAMLGGVTCTESLVEVFDYDSDPVVPDGDFLRAYLDAEITEPPVQELAPTDYIVAGLEKYLTGETPLRVRLTATGSEALPLSVQGNLELLIDYTDLSSLAVRADIQSIAYGDLALENLFIGYENGVAYIRLGDLQAYGSIEEITAIINRLIPLFSSGETADDATGGLDVGSLLSGAEILKNGNISTVHMPLNLGAITIDANLIFQEGETTSFVGANATLGDIRLELTPDDDLVLPEIEKAAYHNVAPLFDIIQDNGDLPLEIAIGDEINALVNIHLADTSADICLGDLQARYTNGTVYLQYADLKVKLALSDAETLVNKILPLLDGKVALPDLNALVQSLDIVALLTQAVDNLSVTETDGVLTIATGLDDLSLALRLSVSNEGYSIGGIEVAMGDVAVTVAPTTATVAQIPDSALNEFNNIATLLDIIDENGEINLTATLGEITADVNIDLSTLTIMAKAELFGETLFVKFAENKVYASYLGLNIYADIADIDTVLEKLAPVIGEVDLSALGNIDLQALLDSVTIDATENGLTIGATLFGIAAEVLFNTTDGNLTLAQITLPVSETLTATIAPCEKADYSAMPTATYYNIVSLLDILDDEGKISLVLTVNETAIDVTVDLANMYLYAGVVGVDVFADLREGVAYVRYPGIQGALHFADLNGMLEQLQPLLDKFAGDTALSGLDLSGLNDFTFDINDLLSTVQVTEGEQTLSISLEFSGIPVTLRCATAGGNLTFDSVAVTVDTTSITGVTRATAYTPYFDLSETYIDAKELVDTFIQPLTDILTSDTLTATIGGTIVSGATTIEIDGTVDIAGLTSAVQAKAVLNIAIATANEDGTTSTSAHEIFLVYKDLTLVTTGAPNVYFYYNNLSDASDKLEGTFTTSKIDESLNALKEIYKNMPELAESLKPILMPDENGYPVLPDMQVDVLGIINEVTLANKVLTVNLNGQSFMASLPQSMVATLANEEGALVLAIPSLAMDGMSIDGLRVTIGKPADGAITDETFAYTTGDNVSDFTSIDTLLHALSNVAEYRSFAINGTVNMTALAIPINDKIKISAQLEVIDDKTYAVVQLTREYVVLAWNDYGGNATIYFDPVEKLVYVKDVSKTKLLSSTYNTTYTKYTVDEFMADIANILVNIMHFSDTIKDAILNSETAESTATIENTFLGYAYDSAASKFTINLDFEPMLGQIQTVDLDIYHDSNMNVSSLYATAKMVSVITLTLDASLSTYEDGAQGLASVIAAQRTNSNYTTTGTAIVTE